MLRPAIVGAGAILLAGCGSTAPYTLGAAAINTAVAVGASAAQRAEGGCYATCTHGTVCNARTGLCEAAETGQYCEEAPGGGMRCVPLEIGKKQEPAPEATLPVGVSPATGTVQPPPAEASPHRP